MTPENIQGWSGPLDESCAHYWTIDDQDDTYPVVCENCQGRIALKDGLRMLLKAVQGQ